MDLMPALDFLDRASAEYLERLYAQYERDPKSVDGQWRAFFAGLEAGSNSAPPALATSGAAVPIDRMAEGAADLVHSYRELGHCLATLDPLGHVAPRPQPLLALAEFGFSEAD